MALSIDAATRKDKASGKGATLEHRHFAFIAATIADMPRGLRSATAQHFASAFASSNPRFDRARFLTACGEGEG